MAAGTTSNTLCEFERCSSRVDNKTEPTLETTCSGFGNNICYFYLNGNCRYADTCWYEHPVITEDSNIVSKSLKDELDVELSYHQVDSGGNVNVFFDKSESKIKSPFGPDSLNWINAPEFIPKSSTLLTLKQDDIHSESQKDIELCSHFIDGECPYDNECPYVHGDLCELCRKYCLHPFDEELRILHIAYCESELVLNPAIQRSLDKTCGICLDVVLEKKRVAECCFGILENCNHVFCVKCIKRWRKVEIQQNEPSVVGFSCPLCRTLSAFFVPSSHCVDTHDERINLIADYKMSVSTKPCKYFRNGKGTCPFGGTCFHLHALPDGTKVNSTFSRRKRRQDYGFDRFNRFMDSTFLSRVQSDLDENLDTFRI